MSCLMFAMICPVYRVHFSFFYSALATPRCLFSFFFLLSRHPPRSTLFPYTTLFRSLLADHFKEPALQIWKYDARTLEPAMYGPGGKVPLKPFAGTIGVAPAEPGLHSVVPPRRVGGNIDIRDVAAGVMLYLPVEVPGALFSIGDTHAAQGDGEVCGTAIESRMD